MHIHRYGSFSPPSTEQGSRAKACDFQEVEVSTDVCVCVCVCVCGVRVQAPSKPSVINPNISGRLKRNINLSSEPVSIKTPQGRTCKENER